jgi:hypothetical protein
MKIEIDQSGRIEETNRDTVLAFSNGKSHSVRISGRTKRKIQEQFRQIGEPKVFMISTFITVTYLLIKDYLNDLHEIVIDVEYPGHEATIIKVLKAMANANKINNNPDIYFGLIGKHSKAHIKALAAFKKKQKVDSVISYEEIVSTCFKYKNGRPVLTYRVYDNSTPLRPICK